MENTYIRQILTEKHYNVTISLKAGTGISIEQTTHTVTVKRTGDLS